MEQFDKKTQQLIEINERHRRVSTKAEDSSITIARLEYNIKELEDTAKIKDDSIKDLSKKNEKLNAVIVKLEEEKMNLERLARNVEAELKEQQKNSSSSTSVLSNVNL